MPRTIEDRDCRHALDALVVVYSETPEVVAEGRLTAVPRRLYLKDAKKPGTSQLHIPIEYSLTEALCERQTLT